MKMYPDFCLYRYTSAYRVHKTAVTVHMARCGSVKAEHIGDPGILK